MFDAKNLYFFSNYVFKQNIIFYIKGKGASTKNFSGGGEVGLGESVKKGNFATNIFFQIMLNEALKSCKKCYLLV